MNVIARLEYELAYYDSAVHRFNHYTTRTPLMSMVKIQSMYSKAPVWPKDKWSVALILRVSWLELPLSEKIKMKFNLSSFLLSQIERWPHNGYVKKLQRKDGSYFYYNRTRECPEKDVPKTKMYAYWKRYWEKKYLKNKKQKTKKKRNCIFWNFLFCFVCMFSFVFVFCCCLFGFFFFFTKTKKFTHFLNLFPSINSYFKK